MSDRAPSPSDWSDNPAELAPLAPFVYSAWADGVLSDEEIGAFRGSIHQHLALPSDAREALEPWIDPQHGPTPIQLRGLGKWIRGVELDDRTAACSSLTDLGLALWRATGREGPWAADDAVAGLRALEAALGLPGAEAARRAAGVAPKGASEPSDAPVFDAASLRAYLDRPHAELRDGVRGLLTEPALMLPLELDKDEYRELVLEAVRRLAREGIGSLGYPEEFGGGGEPAAAIAAFETLALGDLSVLVKFGVQFGLFGGSVLQLGTERHHQRYLQRIASLELPGCYAMTEVGHGSNVRALETTATYDPEADELVVHTPNPGAAKDWIGNAARHGRLATVFARLVVDDVDHGIHAVLVPIRDEQGTALPHVRIEDRGLKEGLNGVDNGLLWFDQARVPRENLLDRFATIDDEGSYSSPIASQGRRFFTMLGTLVAGRISVAAASVSATKVGLAVAIRYTEERRQFGPDGGPEQPVLEYLALQRTLLPRLAATYAAHFAVRGLQERFAADAEDPTVEVSAAALKAYASELCVETLQACREACGGQGYLAENRLAALKADTDVFTTFEGANLVLYQLVTKGLLSRYRDEMGDLSLWGAARYIADRAETGLTELNPVITRRTDPEHLLDPEFHLAALTYRRERLLRSLALRLRARIADGADTFQALNEVQDHAVELARAHAECLLLEHLQEGISRAPTPGLSEALASLSALFALSRIEHERGWYLESGYLEAGKARAVRAQVNALCRETRECARLLVDAFGIPEPLMPDLVRVQAAD